MPRPIIRRWYYDKCKRFYIEKYLDNDNNSINNDSQKTVKSNIELKEEIVKKESDDMICNINKDCLILLF